MAAPTFVGAGAGVTIASGSAACTAAGSGVAVGDLVILQVLQDGTAASAVTYSAISGIANLAGTASSLTVLATDQTCGTLAKQHLRVGRATSTTCSVTVATTGDDLYYRLYVFRDVNSGTALTDILENGTAGTIANGSGATAAVADTGVTTLDVDRLPLQFVGVDDDNPVGGFASPSGGVWVEAVPEFASATGTDGCIQLQLGYIGNSVGAGGTTVFGSIGNDVVNTAKATKFTAPSTGIITLCQVSLVAVGVPTDDLIVEIQTNTGSNLPSNTIVAGSTSATLNVTSTTAATYTAAVAAPVTSGSVYWIVFRRSGAIDSANYYRCESGGGTEGTATRGVSLWASTGAASEAHLIVVGSSVAGTINGGSFTMAAADNWGVIGFALKPVPAVSGTNWTQPVDDTLSLSDSATTQAGKSATIGDSLAVADSASSAAVFARTIADPLSLADSQAFQRDVALPIADSLALADLAAAQRGIAQAVADTLTLADLAATAAGQGVSLADTLALADAATTQAAFLRGLADTLSLADTIAAQSAFQLSIADTLNLADALSSQAAFARALADTLTLADLADPVKGVGGVDHTQPIVDTLALADAFALGRGLSITDTLALADSLSSQAAYLRDIADTLSVLDTVVTAEAGIQQIADTLALADALRFDRTLALADVLTIADAFTAGSDLTRAIADTLALADSLTAQKAILRALADTVSLADALRFGRALGLTDTVALADAVSFQAAYLRTLADTVSLADAVTAGRELTRALADTVTLLDSLAATLGQVLTLEDVLALADELNALLTAAVGAPPRASGLIDFPGIGVITRPTRGARVGNNRGNINTSHQGVLTKPTRGAT